MKAATCPGGDGAHAISGRKGACKRIRKQGQALYAIVQGGLFPGYAEQSAKYFNRLEIDGYALGG